MERSKPTLNLNLEDPPPSYSSVIRSSIIPPSAASAPTPINSPYLSAPTSNPPYPVSPQLNRPPYPVTPESSQPPYPVTPEPCQPPYPIPPEDRLPTSGHRISTQEYKQIPFPMPISMPIPMSIPMPKPMSIPMPKPMSIPMPISMPQPMSIPESPSTFQRNLNSLSQSDREAGRSVSREMPYPEARSSSNYRNYVARPVVRNEQSTPRDILVVRRSSSEQRRAKGLLCLAIFCVVVLITGTVMMKAVR